MSASQRPAGLSEDTADALAFAMEVYRRKSSPYSIFWDKAIDPAGEPPRLELPKFDIFASDAIPSGTVGFIVGGRLVGAIRNILPEPEP